MEREKETGKATKLRRGVKKAAAAGAALTAAAGIAVSGMISDPEELLPQPRSVGSAYVEHWEEQPETPEETADPEEEKRRGPRAAIRAWLLGLPLSARLLIVAPLWVLGWLLMQGVSAVSGGLLSPLLSALLPWAAGLLVLLGGFVAAKKLLFPDLPLKKLLEKRSLLGFVLGLLLVAALDTLLPLVWKEGVRFRPLMRLAGTLLVFGGGLLHFALKEAFRRRGLPLETAAGKENEV